MSDPITCKVYGKAGRIRLSRPETTNALSRETFDAILVALDRLEDDDNVEVIIVDHAGEQGFCVGGDAIGLARSGRDDGRWATEYFEHQAHVNRRIHDSVKPVVTIADGPTVGGGIGLLLAARYRVVSDRTMIAFMETAVGMVPDVGASWVLPRLPGAIGMWLALTGAKIVGADIVRRGLADVFVEAGDLPAFVSSLEAGTSALPAVHREPEEDATIDSVFGRTTLPAIIEELEDRANDGWAAKQLAALRRASPTATVEAFELLRRGATFTSFDQALRAEIKVNSRLVRDHDWLSFTRANLIEKDGPATREPASIEAVLARA